VPRVTLAPSAHHDSQRSPRKPRPGHPTFPRSLCPAGAQYSSRGQRPRKTRQIDPTLKGSHETSRPQVALVILNPVFVQQRDELLLEGQLLVPFLLAGNVVLQGFHL